MTSSQSVAETKAATEPDPASRACQPKPMDKSPASCQSRPRDISPASCQSRPRDISPASCQSKPRDISPASCQPKPRDKSPASCQSKPRDISPASCQPKPRDISPASCQPKPRDKSPASCQPKPRDKNPVSCQPKPRDKNPVSCQPKPRDISPASRACQPKPGDKKAASAINLMKEDLSQLKDFLNVFKEKDVRSSGSDRDRSQLNALRDDLDLFKNELAIFTGDITGILRKGLRRDGPFTTDIFRIKDDNVRIKDDDRTIAVTAQQEQRRRKKEDASKLKVQVESRRDRDTDESSTIRARTKRGDAGRGNGFKIKVEELQNQGEKEVSEVSLCAEGETQESFKMKELGLGKSEEDFKINVKTQKEQGEYTDRDHAFRIKQDGSSDSNSDSFKVKEESSDEFCVDDWEMVGLEQTAKDESDADPRRRRVGGCLTQMDPLISVSSGDSLLRLRDITLNLQQGEVASDVWTMKNFAQYLTLDPNTANPELVLSHGNRMARREWRAGHVTALSGMGDHPERFEHCPQVLCREGLLDAVYWEVQWTEGVDVGVAYNSLSRKGPPTEGLLGLNQDSWSLECGHRGYTACHGNRRYKWVCPEPFSQTVGLFLDFEAGSLSFFCISPGSMQHLHTFRTSFTEPLYPGFWLWSWGGSVSLHQVELGWESLL